MIWREVLFHRPSPHQWSVIWALWITDNSSVQTHRSNASSNPEEDILSRNQEMSHCFSSLVHNFYIRGLFFLMLCLSHDIFIFFLLNFFGWHFFNGQFAARVVDCVCVCPSLFTVCIVFVVLWAGLGGVRHSGELRAEHQWDGGQDRGRQTEPTQGRGTDPVTLTHHTETNRKYSVRQRNHWRGTPITA